MISIIITGVAVVMILYLINSKLKLNNISMFAVSFLLFSCLGAVIAYQMQVVFLIESIVIVCAGSLLAAVYVGYKHKIIQTVR